MSEIENYIEDLKVGQTANLEHQISDKDIIDFSEVSGDKNPVHLNEDFAKKTIFKKRVAHGFLTASFISTLIASKLPGPGSIYLSQTLKFLAPVFINDLVTVNVKIIEIDLKKKKVKLYTECLKGKDIIVVGEASVLVQSKLKKN